VDESLRRGDSAILQIGDSDGHGSFGVGVDSPWIFEILCGKSGVFTRLCAIETYRTAGASTPDDWVGDGCKSPLEKRLLWLVRMDL